MAHDRNITELTQVVVNAASFLSKLVHGEWSKSNTYTLEEYPGCGIRNNDTFNICSNEQSNRCRARLGGKATSSWTSECLWKCTWQENKFFRNTYTLKEKDFQYDITMTMPKIPKDLRCLDGCTTPSFPWKYKDGKNESLLKCNDYPFASFFGCYLFYKGYNGNFVSRDYFDMAVEACVLSIVDPESYKGETCTTLGVNLWIYNPYLERTPSYTYSSLSSTARIEGPSTGVVAAIGVDIIGCSDFGLFSHFEI
jgi:hypothetical protein